MLESLQSMYMFIFKIFVWLAFRGTAGSHYRTQGSLEFTVYCICLLSAGIAGMHCHTQPFTGVQ